VRGFFAVGVWEPKFGANMGTLVRSAYAFGAAYVFTVGKRYRHHPADTGKATKHMPLFHYAGLGELLLDLPDGAQLVGVERDPEAWPLPAFTHPERAVYLLGGEDRTLPRDFLFESCQEMVSIDTRQCLNLATAGSIVMYDRWLKRTLVRKGDGRD